MDAGFTVAGLHDAVEILVDRWGVPHVYAGSAHDAHVAQGFQAARDRLFQIDLWRRRGLGRLAEVFGARHLEEDRARRLFLHRGDEDTEWSAYPDGTRATVTAFVTGVNAYVDWALESPDDRLPPEFAALGHSPARWSPEDVVRIRTHGLYYNAEQELARALTVRDLGVEAEELRAVREPDGPLAIPDRAVLDGLDDEVLAVQRLAFGPVEFTGAGSNNWVVPAERSATGRPLLANDPHRAITVPSLRYLVHLEAPGLSVIGAGEPSLPGVSIGHNARVAFGLTIWPIDHEDLYVYDLHPTDDTRYRYDGGWEELDVVEEATPVAGEEDALLRLVFTRHGPVLRTDLDARRVVALRATWLEPGMAPYLASLAYQDAADARGFRDALAGWGAPGVNQVFADVDGAIGVQACGRVPRRDGWDGALPVPGDGRYEWRGTVPPDELPGTLETASGALTTSNQCTVLTDADVVATTDWYSPARHERLAAWLDGDAAVDVDTSLRMQGDATNHHGRRLLDRLGALVPAEPGSWWAELQAWDGVEHADSRAASIFQVWLRRHWRPWAVDRCLERLGVADRPDAAARLVRDDALFSDLRPDLRMLDVLDDHPLLADGVATTLGAALDEIRGWLGDDTGRWTWGALHRTELRHPVFAADVAAPRRWRSLPPRARPGSGDTVGLAGHDPTFNAVMGSSFRMVLDVGEWDSSRVVNAPGQSGDPRSEHYDDLLDPWADGESFPLLYSRDAVEDATTERVVLRPPDA